MHILLSAAIMGLAVPGFRFETGISSFMDLIAAVFIGGAVYFLILFWIDSRLQNGIGELMRALGIV
jgi:hypothetical protein